MKVITKNLRWIVFVFLIFQTAVFSQIKIGDNPTVINPSAIMEIESENKGFLLPRLQLVNVSDPAPLLEHEAGMIVYNTATATGLTPGFYYNDGTKWVGVSQSTATGLLSADNGLTSVNEVAKLGGSLIQPTVLNTTAINKKLEGNPAITPGTNTKITYDAKGLVIKEENVMCDFITYF